MNFISQYFQNKKDARLAEAARVLAEQKEAEKLAEQNAIDKATAMLLQQQAIEKETAERAEKLKQENDERVRMESPVAWYELIGDPYDIEAPPIAPIRERYKWNKAFITHLREQGFVGELDYQVIHDWEVKKQEEKAARILKIQREERRNSAEPWIEVISESYDPETKQVAMNLDWNQAFIKMLRSNGYSGRDEQELVDKWFKELSKEIATDIHGQRYDG